MDSIFTTFDIIRNSICHIYIDHPDTYWMISFWNFYWRKGWFSFLFFLLDFLIFQFSSFFPQKSNWAFFSFYLGALTSGIIISALYILFISLWSILLISNFVFFLFFFVWIFSQHFLRCLCPFQILSWLMIFFLKLM